VAQAWLNQMLLVIWMQWRLKQRYWKHGSKKMHFNPALSRVALVRRLFSWKGHQLQMENQGFIT
jgi:glycerol uptake facilitator-like aquaporin